jgi:hypothetical protein
MRATWKSRRVDAFKLQNGHGNVQLALATDERLGIAGGAAASYAGVQGCNT